MRNHIALTVLIGLAAIILACGSGSGSSPGTPLRGLTPLSTVPPKTSNAYSAATPVTPSATLSPDSCGGGWGNQHLSGTAAAAIAGKYGELNRCGLFGNTWVITTYGNSTSGGVVALYACTNGDVKCLDNQQDHPLSGWKFVIPPYPGGVTILAAKDSQTLILDVGGHQLGFDLSTGTFPAK